MRTLKLLEQARVLENPTRTAEVRGSMLGHAAPMFAWHVRARLFPDAR